MGKFSLIFDSLSISNIIFLCIHRNSQALPISKHLKVGKICQCKYTYTLTNIVNNKNTAMVLILDGKSEYVVLLWTLKRDIYIYLRWRQMTPSNYPNHLHINSPLFRTKLTERMKWRARKETISKYSKKMITRNVINIIYMLYHISYHPK